MFVLDDVLEQVQSAARADTRGADGEAMCAEVVALETLRRFLDAREAHLLAELETQKICDRRYGMHAGSWLAREAALPGGACRKRVRVATKLRRWFPDVDEALSAGRITWEHTVVIAEIANERIIDQIAACQRELLDLAADVDFEWWKRRVRGIADLVDQDGGHKPDGDLSDNRLDLVQTFDGMFHLAGTLDGEHGLSTSSILEAKTDELFRRFSADRELAPDLAIPERATLRRALALCELVRQGWAIDLNSTAAPRAEVTLVASASEPTKATTQDGVQLPDGTTRTLLCDPEIHALVTNSLGVPLAMGHKTRYATAAQRRAIALRDGGCVFPGCTMPAPWTDSHHVEHYRPDSGPTDIENLAALCRYHHRVTHRAGWTMYATDDGWFWWLTPSGHTFWSQRRYKRRTGPTPPPPVVDEQKRRSAA